MIYVSSNFQADVKIFRGNDFKDDSQIFCETDRAGQFKYWFIDLKIITKHIGNSQYVHPPPTPPHPQHPLQLHSTVKRMLAVMHENCLLQNVICLLQTFIKRFQFTIFDKH